ncbi:hypothetical protein C1637_02685 [Chryseobacterium lactis]|uniref:Pectate lyase superfamily protein domain-containing protein n=1 Tax=Chryseobacterium lactis TaxID=1241981 RepID=A0A3G6RNK5_CHRLC|nr:hypothetical protein [Chryseobacterium lactis]AZA81497.1 hypothetical protein EG342_06080 [Chryseobacterium lactis]AZB06495.1 hypothetical protein EG341_22200 [Chryseobacterium lactis]PNW15346.1 hypothetical protein C1637_02685 [Chryseobacterium lactis]
MKFTKEFFSATSTDPADDLVQLIDSDSKENVNYEKVTSWYHGAHPVPMTDALCDEIIYRKRWNAAENKNDYYALTSFLAGKPINIELFGAVGDATTDDTEAFQNAAKFVNGLYDFVSADATNSQENWSLEKVGVTLVGNSPVGYRIENTIQFKNPVNFLVEKIFYRGDRDRPALIFQNSHKNVIDTHVTAYPKADFSLSDDFVGILIQGAVYSTIKVGASFFTKGVICEANKSAGIFEGFAWNDIQLKSFQSNLDSFVIRNVNEGWANANRVTGGEFGSFSGLLDESKPIKRRRSFIKFEKDAISSGCNSWLFLNQSFEGKLVDINHNVLEETLCFDFSGANCIGISIVEPRIENVNDERVGVFRRGSGFTFKSGQYISVTDFTDENGIKYIGENPLVLLDKDLSEDYKKDGKIESSNPYVVPQAYVKNLESFNENSGLFPNAYYANKFCQVFKINNPDTSLWVRWHRFAEFVLFDKDRKIITDLVKLKDQIQLINDIPSDFWADITPNMGVIRLGAETYGDYVNSFPFIPDAKYVGILQRTFENARLKVMINKLDIGRIEKVKFLGVPEDTYAMVDDPSSSNLAGFNFNTGEKFYNFSTHKTSVIKESGVGSPLLGYTVDATNGLSTFTVKTGDTAKLSLGTIFYINSVGGTVRFKIVEKKGNVITTNIPSPATVNDEAVTFPLCTYDTY